MKKVFFTLVAVAAVALVSCTGKEKAAENTADTAGIVEEVVEEEAVLVDTAAAPADSVAAPAAADSAAVK